MAIGLIGGSGLEKLLRDGEEIDVRTPYGVIKAVKGKSSNIDIYFIPRHGFRHETPPHKVNYRGNIYALKKLGVDKVIATGAVGSLLDELLPSTIIIIEQFIDFTKRNTTFYDDVVIHVDMSRPYCNFMNSLLFEWGRRLNIPIRRGGVYVCTEGPRFETPAEINMFRILGGTVVGMTNVPEVILAREIGLHYSLLAVVTNYAAGMQEKVDQEEVLHVMSKAGEYIRRILYNAIGELEDMYINDDCILYRDYADKHILKEGF